MTVNELIEQLKTLPADLPVLLASDAEGNDFHELYSAQTELIVADSDTYGYVEVVHPDDAEEYEEGELESCVILWP